MRPQSTDAIESTVEGSADFLGGLVFGFDVGTGSIGYAARKGNRFLDVGVRICDSEGSDLSKRRDLRRSRRTLRSKKYRRKWFSGELANIGLPRPRDASTLFMVPDDSYLHCQASLASLGRGAIPNA